MNALYKALMKEITLIEVEDEEGHANLPGEVLDKLNEDRNTLVAAADVVMRRWAEANGMAVSYKGDLMTITPDVAAFEGDDYSLGG